MEEYDEIYDYTPPLPPAKEVVITLYTKYALLTFSEYYAFNKVLSEAKGYNLEDKTARIAEMTPRLAKINIEYVDEVQTYDLACVFAITVDVQEDYPELLPDMVDTFIPSDEILSEIVAKGMTSQEVDWTLEHYNAVGQPVKKIETDAIRTGLSNDAVNNLKTKATILSGAGTAGTIVTNKFCTVKTAANEIQVNQFVESARIETDAPTIELADTLNEITATNLPDLPILGEWCEGDTSYNNGGEAVYCRQGHYRTIHALSEIPSLFLIIRTDNGELQWMPNETISVGDFRFIGTDKYVCIQSHVSLIGWEPNNTAALWNLVPNNDYANAPQWVSGNWGQYVMDFIVKDSGKIWKVIGTSHTWIQPALTGNGAISWEYVQDA